jgi:bacterioferritin
MATDLWAVLKNSLDDDLRLDETEVQTIIDSDNKKVEPDSNQTVIDILNELVIMEMTGINQYLSNKSIYKNLQFESLVKYIDERINDEYQHHSMLLDRIRYLRGSLKTQETLDKINAGESILDTFKFDAQAERTAIEAYNKAIEIATKARDNGSRSLFETILKDEEDHLDDLGAKLDQIDLIGIQIFLSSQIYS